MTDARTHILAKLERVIDRGDSSPTDAGARIQSHTLGPVPARGRDDGRAQLVERFTREAQLAGSDVHRIPTIDRVPASVVAHLRAKNLPPRLRMSSDSVFAPVSWRDEAGLSVHSGGMESQDTASLSAAVAGVAETGTLVMVSSPENPALYGFMPLAHIVLLPESRISGNYEAVWADLRHRQGERGMPRTVNMITGPSRTADIEQTLLMGAHGPQSLMIMIVGDM